MDRKFRLVTAWRNTVFLGVQRRDIAFEIDGKFVGISGYVIGLGWLELFIGYIIGGFFET